MTTPVASGPQARVTGSNYTLFHWRGNALAYLEQVADSGQPAFGGSQGNGIEVIQPLGYARPKEIVAGRVVGAGQLTLTFRETWHKEVWEQLPGLTGTENIVQVFAALRNMASPVSASKIIKAPDGFKRGKTYHNVTIATIDDSDTFNIGSITVPKNIVAYYTHTTKLSS